MACMPSTPARSGAASSPPCSWTRTNYAWCRCPAAKRRSGLPQVIDELEVERMPGIRRVPLARHHAPGAGVELGRSEEHTSELQSLMRISYAVFCLKKNTSTTLPHQNTQLH